MLFTFILFVTQNDSDMSGSKVPSGNTRIQTGSLKPNMKELCKQYTNYKEILEAVLTKVYRLGGETDSAIR